MAFPSPLAEVTGSTGGSVTTHPVTVPAHSDGDRIRVVMSFDGGPTISGIGNLNGVGWTKQRDVKAGGVTLAIWTVTAGSDQGTDTTVDVTTNVTEQSVFRTTVWASSVEFDFGAAVTGLDVNPNPGSLSPSWGSADTRWTAVCAYDTGTTTVTAYPASYSTGQFNDTSGAAAGAGLGTASRDVAAATEDAGAFTISAAEEWAAVTIATRDTAGGTESETVTDDVGITDGLTATLSEPETLVTIGDVIGIDDGGTGSISTDEAGEVVGISDGVSWSLLSPPVDDPVILLAGLSDWSAYVVHRVPSQSGVPTLSELGQIPFTTLTWTRRLNQPDQVALSAPIQSVSPEIRSALGRPWLFPLELWVFRHATPMAAGPIWPGTIQGQTLTVNAGGILDYLRGMIGTSSDLSFTDIDQGAIIRDLLDHYQAKEYGHFGIDTTTVAFTGVTRTRNYLAAEPSDLLTLVQQLTAVNNGADVDIALGLDGTTITRTLRVHYPHKGREDHAVLDASVVTSSNVTYGAGPADIASVAVVYGGDSATAPIRGEAVNSDLLASWGRWGAAETASNVITGGAVADHAAALLAARDGRIYLPGPDLRATVEVNPATIDVGDEVTYDYDDGLGTEVLTGRLAEVVTTVDAAGERMRVQLA